MRFGVIVHTILRFQEGIIANSLLELGIMMKTSCIDYAHSTEFVTYMVCNVQKICCVPKVIV